MRNFKHIVYLGVCLFGLSAHAEALLLTEEQLGQDLFLKDATEQQEVAIATCDYWTELFDGETLSYTKTCLSFGSFAGSGVASSFEDASSSWTNDMSAWSDTRVDMPTNANSALDLDGHYLAVYEEAEANLAINSAENYLLMNNQQIERNSIREMLGNSFAGQDVRKSGDPTADLKALLKDAEQMGKTNFRADRPMPMPGEIVEDIQTTSQKGEGNGYKGDGTFGLPTDNSFNGGGRRR